MKAFPSAKYINERGHQCFNTGMDLRDYFAAKAMAALISASVTEPGKVGPADNISEYAYAYADAMIEQRKENQNA